MTSTGTVQGVQRRVQTRLGQTAAPPFFALAGLIGLDSLELVNSVQIATDIGSNGPIMLGNSVEVDGDAYVGPGGSVDDESDLKGDVVQLAEPFVPAAASSSTTPSTSTPAGSRRR